MGKYFLKAYAAVRKDFVDFSSSKIMLIDLAPSSEFSREIILCFDSQLNFGYDRICELDSDILPLVFTQSEF